MFSFQNCSGVKEQKINTVNFNKIRKVTEGNMGHQTEFYCHLYCRKIFIWGGGEEGGLLFHPHLGKAGGQAEKPPTLLAGGLFLLRAEELACALAKNQREQGWNNLNPKAKSLLSQPATRPVQSAQSPPFTRLRPGFKEGSYYMTTSYQIWCRILVFQLEIKQAVFSFQTEETKH